MRENGITLCTPDNRCTECQDMSEADFKQLLAAHQNNERRKISSIHPRALTAVILHRPPRSIKNDTFPSDLQIYRLPSELSNIAANVIDLAKSDAEGPLARGQSRNYTGSDFAITASQPSLDNLDVSSLNSLSVTTVSKTDNTVFSEF